MPAQFDIQKYISDLDKELAKYKFLNDIEQRFGLPKVYLCLGAASLSFFFVFFNVAANFLTQLIGFGLPAYWSLGALFTHGTVDDTQWLTYWVVYAFLSFIETAISATYWFPLYYTFKLVLILWLALPQFNGAQIAFKTVLTPLFGRFFTTGTSANLKAAGEKAQ